MSKTNNKLGTAVKATKEALTVVQTTLAGLVKDVDDPLKSKWQEALNNIQVTIAGLPDPADAEDNQTAEVLPAITSAYQLAMTNLQGANTALNEKLQTTLAGIPAQIDAAIDARVKSGDLIPKAAVEQRVQDATAAATTAARDSALAESKRINARRTELTTAGLPVPADEILTGEDAAYAAKKTDAEKRVKELAPFKLAADRVLTLAWNTDATAYQASFDLMKTAFEAAGNRTAGANPFISPTGGDNNHKPIRGTTFLC